MAIAKQSPKWAWREPVDWTATAFETVTVTPELAQYIYDNLGDFNRKISPKDAAVREYAIAMRAGKWALQNLIEFDTKGRLVNGYHRMLAVILSGVPVKFFFRYGADPANVTEFDNGKNRDAQDTIEIAAHNLGEEITAQDAKLLGSSIPWIVLYEAGKASLPFRITPAVQRDFYLKRYSVKRGEDFSIREWLPICRKVAKKLTVAESVIFALMVLGSKVFGKKGLTKDFWQGVATGASLPLGDPRLMFNERIINLKAELKGKGKLQRDTVYLLGLKCMRVFLDDPKDKIGNLVMPKKIVRLSEEHDEMFGDVEFVSPYGEVLPFNEENLTTMTELIEKHADRG